MTSRCPTCNSPSPERHPAQGFEGEVTLCTDAWHAPAQHEPDYPLGPDREPCRHCDQNPCQCRNGSQPEPAAPTVVEPVFQALENCRLYAARHRKEEWSAVIRRFCFEGGAIGSPLRGAAPTVVEPLKGWKLNHVQFVRGSGKAEIGYLDPEDDRFSPIVTVDTGLYYEPNQAHPLAIAILGALQDATPPRAAQPLTQPQIRDCAWGYFEDSSNLPEWVEHFVRAIEAAHGITADRGEK